MNLPDGFEGFIREATEEELKTMANECWAEIKDRRKLQARRTKRSLKPGTICIMSGLRKQRHNGMECEVLEVKQTRAVVSIDGERWRVPISCLTIKDRTIG